VVNLISNSLKLTGLVLGLLLFACQSKEVNPAEGDKGRTTSDRLEPIASSALETTGQGRSSGGAVALHLQRFLMANPEYRLPTLEDVASTIEFAGHDDPRYAVADTNRDGIPD
jgi:hypothetical protein